MRVLYFSAGWLFVGLGIIGAFLPVLPTTPFMLLALLCFSQSSPRFHDWLYYHRIFGPPLQAWEQRRVISRRTKVVSVSMMSASLAYLIIFSHAPAYIIIIAALMMLCGAWFILTKPSD